MSSSDLLKMYAESVRGSNDGDPGKVGVISPLLSNLYLNEAGPDSGAGAKVTAQRRRSPTSIMRDSQTIVCHEGTDGSASAELRER